jgi:hypothetical protein
VVRTMLMYCRPTTGQSVVSPVNDFHPLQPLEGFRPDSAQGWEMAHTGPAGGAPEGQIMSGHAGPNRISVVGPSGHHSIPEEEDEYMKIYSYDQTTPYHPHHHPQQPPNMPMSYMHSITPFQPGSTSVPHSISPTAMMGQHGRPMMQQSLYPNEMQYMHPPPMQQQHYYHPAPPRRPGMQARHSMVPAPRQYSLQPPPTRAIDPAQDVFAIPSGSTPIRRPATTSNDFQLPAENVSVLLHTRTFRLT